MENDSERKKALFAYDCRTTLCVLGKRPTSAKYFLEPQDVPKFIEEMAIRVQSKKRNLSMTNLLDIQNTRNLFADKQDWKDFDDTYNIETKHTSP